jgi:hypothetical protein
MSNNTIIEGGKMKMPLDWIVEKIVALGVPGLVLLVAVATSGYAGGAAIVSALATLGGSLGMLGGIGLLLLLVLLSNGLAKHGFEKIFKGVVQGLRDKKGLSQKEILDKIESYPITKNLKLTLKDLLS